MRQFTLRIVALMIVIITAWQITSDGRGASPQLLQVLPEVETALMEEVAVRVIINLNLPDVSSMSKGDQISAIQALQNSTLSGLTADDFTLKRRFQAIPAIAGEITKAGLKSLQGNENVISIQLDLPIEAHDSDSLNGIQANIVHSAYGITGQGVTVVVLDTGIDIDHPDFSGRIVAQHCFTDSDCQPGNVNESSIGDDLNGHGTNVAGVIASNGLMNANTKGFAPTASLVAVRVLDRYGSGWTSDWLAGLEWVYANLSRTPVNVINMSLGTRNTYSGNCDGTWYSTAGIIQALNAAGVTIFASTGNSGNSNEVSAPACLSYVTGVGATYDGNLGRQPVYGNYYLLYGGSWPECFDSSTSLNTITCFTNSNTMMDLVAPGAYITSSGMGGGTSTYGGTSQASPTAAGVAALMLDLNPALTPVQIEQAMQATGVPVVDSKNGRTFKRIDALKAVQSQTKISISGNRIGLVGEATTFTARVKPFASTVPITYIWQVEGYPTYTSTDPSLNTAAYNFSIPGSQQINLTVTNGGGTFTASHNIFIYVSLPNKVYLPLVVQ